jgi:hypothetical protein
MKLADAFGRCAEIENRIGDTYERFAGRWAADPEIAGFWREMTEAERTHAAVLEAAAEYFAASDRREPIDPASIAHVRGCVRGMTTLVGKVDLTEALRIALELESLELDVIYGKLVVLAGEDFWRISRTILESVSALDRHEEALLDAIERFTDDAGLIRDARQHRKAAKHRRKRQPSTVTTHLSTISKHLSKRISGVERTKVRCLLLAWLVGALLVCGCPEGISHRSAASLSGEALYRR